VKSNDHINSLVPFTREVKVFAHIARNITAMAESSEVANAGSSSTGTKLHPLAIFEAIFLTLYYRTTRDTDGIILDFRAASSLRAVQ
jgi:hypothetical protein